MKCDELKYEKLGDMMPFYPRSTLVIRKQFVDTAITELKARIHELESMPHTDNSAVIERISNENERLKSEADKAIAEKDAEIARLKDIRKVHVEAIESMGAGLLQDYDEIHHQKYKRCLAMVQVLEHVCPMTNRKAKFRDKWHKRWLAIAEKFKPNSTAQ